MDLRSIRLRAVAFWGLVPVLASAVLIALASLMLAVLAAVAPAAPPHLATVVVSAAVIPAALAAAWTGTIVGRRMTTLPAVAPPLAAGASLALLACLPVVGEAWGEQRRAALVGAAVWATAVAAVAAARPLRRRPGGTLPGVVLGAGVALHAGCLAFGYALDGSARPSLPASAWYLQGVSGLLRDGGEVCEAFKAFPAVTTVVTLLVLAAVYSRPIRTPGAETSTVT
ncbi:MAG TPA: hypothetical protein VFY17_04190 [Pilimelia sp.]|nr:hypothetical protein [Pilimelia sp.]